MRPQRVRRSARRRTIGALAVAAALTTVVTVGVRPTTAAWVASASVGQSVGVASSTCTTPGVYRTTSTSRFLAGSVAGVPLGASAGLAALTASNDAGTIAFPTGVTMQGRDAATSTVPSGAASAAAAPLSPTGAHAQYAAARSTGISSAAAGAVTAGGAIDGAAITNGTAPTVGGVAVSSALAGVTGGTAAAGQLSQLRLTTGAAAATATLNECVRRWGASLSSALTRTVEVRSVDLSTRASAVSDLLAAAADRTTIDAAVSGVTGGSATSSTETAIGTAAGGDLATAVRNAVGALLSASVGTPSATVTVTSDFSGVTTAAQQTVAAPSAPVRLNGATKDLTVDLSAIAGTTSPAPNTDLLSAATTSAIAAGVSGASGALVDAVDRAWSTSLDGTTIRADLSVPIAGLGTVTATLSGRAIDFVAGTETVSGPVLTLLPNASLPLGIGLDLTAVTALIRAIPTTQLTGSARSVVGTQVVTPLTGAITSTRTALGAALMTARSRIAGQLAVLPDVVAVTLNEQPDVAPFPTPVAGMGTGYQVTAVRVKVLGGRALDVAIDATSVGPDTTINE
ncbi:choice-of-anchor G family protein [Amnibacterium kyonggiense]|uniref:Uncharacterized protein n=1 Tax=Amnibacterium kyonggiense TaxID=595671 RepID=A0A4R7FT46_9MICO|nr:choice-of-anchor G family protein [Amnibacterium kyonggiense]TDS81043.1 hypothetical protein CLV52_1617 [Amnibacterium kyonggiense]